MNILWGSMIIIGVIYSFFNGVPLTEAVISSGKDAVDMAITMLGIVPIWCGMLNIAEKAGTPPTSKMSLNSFARPVSAPALCIQLFTAFLILSNISHRLYRT